MTRPGLRLVVLAMATAGACGGASPTVASSYTLIDDMEGEPPTIAWLPPGGALPGRWFSSTDCTQADRVLPPSFNVDPDGWSYDLLPEPHETFPGVTSRHATRLRTTSPLMGVWGAAAGFNFVDGPPWDAGPHEPDFGPGCTRVRALDFMATAVDLTAYTGVTFWAMAASGRKTVQVRLRDWHSDPHGGFCNAADPADDEGCYNDFGTTVVLNDSFTRYTIDFSSLAQNPNWGVRPDPSVLDLQRVYTLIFEVDLPTCVQDDNSMCAGGSSAPVSFDFRIDDVYFVNR
jgi:hypothetical protein